MDTLVLTPEDFTDRPLQIKLETIRDKIKALLQREIKIVSTLAPTISLEDLATSPIIYQTYSTPINSIH